MDEHQIAERAEQIKALGYDSELAWKIAKAQAKTDETKQLIDKIWKQLRKHGQSPAEIGLIGLPLIVGLAAYPGPLAGIAAVMSFVVSSWQRDNQNKCLGKLEQQIQQSGANLDQSPLNFDEFMELFYQFMEIASKSAFEEKQNYLVNLFVNSVVSSAIPFSGKQVLFRLHSQISLEEIRVLKVIYDIEIQTQRKSQLVSVKEVAEKLGWKYEEVFVTCQALAQLFLLRDGMMVSEEELELSDDSEPKHYVWQISELARRFIQWVTEELPAATTADGNTSDSRDITEKTAWSQLTTEQFFSGYSDADAIYDQIWAAI